MLYDIEYKTRGPSGSELITCFLHIGICLKIVNEYDQEIPQSQTADNPVAP